MNIKLVPEKSLSIAASPTQRVNSCSIENFSVDFSTSSCAKDTKYKGNSSSKNAIAFFIFRLIKR
jgi:hypothetical protein